MVLTICPRSSDPFYIVRYYIQWVTTSWTQSILLDGNANHLAHMIRKLAFKKKIENSRQMSKTYKHTDLH